MVNNVQSIATHEHPNALCAICLKNGRMVKASALRTFETWTTFYVCEGHEARARRWIEIEAISKAYRSRTK